MANLRPISLAVTLNALMHGEYNKIKTKNDIALGTLKCTTLVVNVKLVANADKFVTPLEIAKDDTTISLATIPTNNATTIRGLENPSGLNIG